MKTLCFRVADRMSTPQVIGEIRGRSEDVLLVKGGWSCAAYVTPGGSFHSFCLNKSSLHLVVSRLQKLARKVSPKCWRMGWRTGSGYVYEGVRGCGTYLWANVYALARSLSGQVAYLRPEYAWEQRGAQTYSPIFPSQAVPFANFDLEAEPQSKYLTCP